MIASASEPPSRERILRWPRLSRWAETAYIEIEPRSMATTSSNLDLQSPPPARFITLSVHAGEVFANQEKALSWLHSANPSLAGRTPLEAAVTEEGFAEADDILTRLAYGVLG